MLYPEQEVANFNSEQDKVNFAKNKAKPGQNLRYYNKSDIQWAIRH